MHMCIMLAEPALNSKGYDASVKGYYEAALHTARAHLPTLPLVMSFIPPNDFGVPAFIRRLQENGGGDLLIDHRESALPCPPTASLDS